MLKRAFLFLALTALLSASGRADPYRLLNIALYQTDTIMKDRVGTSVDLVGYVKALNTAATDYFSAHPAGTPGILNIVVAFKPSGKSKVWLLTSNTTLENPDGLILKLQAVPAPKPVGGPIAFCLHASLWGGADTSTFSQPPYPKEWLDASQSATQPLSIPDGVLEVIWKD
jgi:hypothetical protein